MIASMMLILYGVTGALCWRLRGGALDGVLYKAFGFKLGDTFARASSSLFLAIPVLHVNWKTAGLVWGATFVGMTLPYFGKSMSAETPREVFLMSVWGLCITTCATFFLWPPEFIALTGLVAGPIYWSMHRFENHLPRVSLPPFVGEGWSAWAELVAGSVVGFSMAAALIW